MIYLNEKKSIFTIVVLSFIQINNLLAGKIVDVERFQNFYTITYSPAQGIVECTAFNSNGDGIGGAQGYSSRGVATVMVMVPRKYAGKKLEFSCK